MDDGGVEECVLDAADRESNSNVLSVLAGDRGGSELPDIRSDMVEMLSLFTDCADIDRGLAGRLGRFR